VFIWFFIPICVYKHCYSVHTEKWEMVEVGEVIEVEGKEEVEVEVR
jgi:hypothetical protein